MCNGAAFGDADILRLTPISSPGAKPKNPIADFERGDIVADRLDQTGEVDAEYAPPRRQQAVHQSRQNRRMRLKLSAIGSADACRVNAHQYIAWRRPRRWRLGDLDDARRTVARNQRRLHGRPPNVS